MNNIICKENENKVIEILTSDFNAMLKENGIEWEVVENNHMTPCQIYTKNNSDKHEPFEYVMFKQFDVELKTFQYKKVDGNVVSSKVELEFEFCEHSNSYNKLIESDVEDVSEYVAQVKRLLRDKIITQNEAVYLMEVKDLDVLLLG